MIRSGKSNNIRKKLPGSIRWSYYSKNCMQPKSKSNNIRKKPSGSIRKNCAQPKSINARKKLPDSIRKKKLPKFSRSNSNGNSNCRITLLSS
jgi:hypothetical protein